MIKQVVCWILLLQTINISINPPDVKLVVDKTVTNNKQLAADETESIYEWVVEGMSDEDVPESDDDDMDTSSPSFELYFFNRVCSELPVLHFSIEHYAHYHTNFPFIHQEPHSPPPKWA